MYAALPNLASAHEQGLADFEAPTRFAVFLPRGASERIISKLKPSSVRKSRARNGNADQSHCVARFSNCATTPQRRRPMIEGAQTSL
jgi:hypothetical protein